MPESLIKVLELIQPPPSFMKAVDFIFGKKVSDGCAWDAWKGCCLAVWDGIAGKWRRE
jgi:hypothetical protein